MHCCYFAAESRDRRGGKPVLERRAERVHGWFLFLEMTFSESACDGTRFSGRERALMA